MISIFCISSVYCSDGLFGTDELVRSFGMSSAIFTLCAIDSNFENGWEKSIFRKHVVAYTIVITDHNIIKFGIWLLQIAKNNSKQKTKSPHRHIDFIQNAYATNIQHQR